MTFRFLIRLLSVILFIFILDNVDKLVEFTAPSLVFNMEFNDKSEFIRLLNQNSGKMHGKQVWMGDDKHQSFNFDKQRYIKIAGFQKNRIKNAVTIEVWIKPSLFFSSDADTRIVMKGNYIWGISRDERPGSAVIHAYINRGSNHLSAPVVPGEWHYVVLKYDIHEKIIKLFVDGELKDQKNYSEKLESSNDSLFIGGDGSQNYTGLISSIRIYNRSLSDDEIRSSYVQGHQRDSVGDRQGDNR